MFLWDAPHTCAACTPTSGNVASWSNFPWLHAVSVTLWHVSHVVGNPAATWFGFVVAWYFGRWQPAQSRGVPLKTFVRWHAPHACVAWTPWSAHVAWAYFPCVQFASAAL